MNIIGKKNLYFLASGIVIIPGILSLVFFGLRLSIDFTGGSVLEAELPKSVKVDSQKIREVASFKDVHIHQITLRDTREAREVSIRISPIDQNRKEAMVKKLRTQYPAIQEKSFDTVGPTIGNETKLNALKAVLFASIAITLYIAWAFREVSKPVASWKFGVCAIVALLHDVLVVVGVFSLLGRFAGVEVDTLFITALLTVMGFSVHDTIVVFDRIRENLRKSINLPFEKVVNNSILETLNRSLNTSLTVILVLFALLSFGGESIRWFVAALLIGVVSGTYSSIFNASPLLVVWEEWGRKRVRKQA